MDQNKMRIVSEEWENKKHADKNKKEWIQIQKKNQKRKGFNMEAWEK